jgi:hypothetical protein
MNKNLDVFAKMSYVEVPHERDSDATSSVFHKEKFAEFIIRECCRLVNERYYFNSGTQHLPDFDCIYVEDIKQHFGVK